MYHENFYINYNTNNAIKLYDSKIYLLINIFYHLVDFIIS